MLTEDLVSFYVFNSTLDVEESVMDKGKTTHFTISTSRIELRKKRNQTPCKERAFDFFWYSTPSVDPMIIITVMLFLSSLPNIIFLHVLVLLIISAHLWQRPSWTPNAKPNAPCLRSVLFHFRCLTRFWIWKRIFLHNLKPSWNLLTSFKTQFYVIKVKQQVYPRKDGFTIFRGYRVLFLYPDILR